MKSVFLNDIINTNDCDEINILLLIKEKISMDNEIKYVLGDITQDVEYTTSEDYEIEQIVLGTWNNGRIKKVILYEGDYELKDFIPHSQRDIKSILNQLEILTTDSFKNEEAIRLNNYFFLNEEFVNMFSKAIGGFGHHIYIGGLAQHTLDVVYWTDKLSKRYNCKYRDIAVLSAKLHDIGKIYEYSNKGTFKSTFRGEMEGHVVIGITMIEEAFKNDEYEYSEDFKNRVKGCIVQHHGMPEYGSPKNPNTEEAYMVHFADYIDATMNKIAKIKAETKDNQWSEFCEELKTKIFI